MTDHMQIKLRRSKLNIKDSSNKDSINKVPLEFGEAQYFNYQSDSTNDSYLILGDSTSESKTANTDLKRFKAFDKSIVDNQVFYIDSTFKDESGNEIYPSTTSDKVSYGTSTVEASIDELTNWKTNLKYASSQSAGGAADSALKLETNGGSNQLPVYFESGIPKSVATVGSGTLIDIDISGSATKATTATTCEKIKVGQKDSTLLYVVGTTDLSSNGTSLYTNSSITITTGNVIKGAAWNDFAEFRHCCENAGCVVVEKGDGSLVKSNKRLLPGASIVSDTYGMVIGKDEENYAPVAVAGRVLAYADKKEKLKAGDSVCTGYNGTVSKMSRLETILFPDRIIGYVSEIPSYDT